MADGITKAYGPEDPDRCSAMMAQGQCMNKKQFGTEYCVCHGANEANFNAKQVRTYRLQKWQARVHEFADDDKVKSLREEVGILRMLMEEQLQQCKDASQLLVFSSTVSRLVLDIKTVVESCHKLETSTGKMLDKAALLQFASEVISIISDEISILPGGQDILDKISERMFSSLSNTSTVVKATKE